MGFDPTRGFESVPCPDLPEAVIEMGSNGVAANPDPPRYLPVSEPLGHQHQELQFPPREWTCACSLSVCSSHEVFRVVRFIEKTVHPVK